MNQEWVNDWYSVGVTTDVPSGAVIRRRVGPVDLALFNLEGDFFAWQNACSRCGKPLSDGKVKNKEVECEGCGFCLSILQQSDPSATPGYPIMIVDDEVFVWIENTAGNSRS